MDITEKKSSIAPPPPPEMTIRTMASDLRTLETSGGIGATAQVFSPAFEEEIPARETSFAAPGYTGPEKAIFTSRPIVENERASSGGSRTMKIVFVIAGGMILIGIFWLAGYYIIFPWFFPPQMPAVQ